MTLQIEQHPSPDQPPEEATNMQLINDELFSNHAELIEQYDRAKAAEPRVAEMPAYLEETHTGMEQVEPAKLTIRGTWRAIRNRFSRNRSDVQAEPGDDNDLANTLIDYDEAPTSDLSRPSLRQQLAPVGPAVRQNPHAHDIMQAEQVFAMPAVKPRSSESVGPADEAPTTLRTSEPQPASNIYENPDTFKRMSLIAGLDSLIFQKNRELKELKMRGDTKQMERVEALLREAKIRHGVAMDQHVAATTRRTA
jgi:hypothetical protein